MTSCRRSELFPLVLRRIHISPEGSWRSERRAAWVDMLTRLGRLHGCPISLEPAARSESSIRLQDWGGEDVDLFVWDARVQKLEAHESPVLVACADDTVKSLTGLQHLLNRYQRLLPLPEDCMVLPRMAGLFALHRSLHDVSLPLVKADYDHALDTWRWLLRLAPDADLALQAAALFHDIERLESESEMRKEQFAADYLDFKVRHARRGCEILRHRLADASVESELLLEICDLVENHEQPSDDPRLQLLNDADGLSFFSLNSFGYLRYFGPDRAREKVRYTLSRLSSRARQLVRRLPHHPSVWRLFEAEHDENASRARQEERKTEQRKER